MSGTSRKLVILALALACACSGGSSKETGGAGSGDKPRKAKFVNLSLEILPASGPDEIDAGGLEEITLILTNETGSTRRIPIGEYPGPCEDISHRDRKTPMKPILSVLCRGGEGLRIRLLQKNRKIVLFRAPGIQGDDFDFDEFHEYEMPKGAAITTEQR
ncbi:MAG TPA: hypothetical protein VFU21_17730 [Kofleriaceae bacterium]|nr:hypothetical protein [Kofleriaceae bacterium]